MATLGTASEKNLEGVHPSLVAVVRVAIKVMDFTVDDGVRTPEEQRAYRARGVSWTLNSKHLVQADGFSHAVDLHPYLPAVPSHVDWDDTEIFCVLAGVMFAAALTVGIKLRWGGDWNQNWQTSDEKRRDYGHFELVE